MTGKRQKKTAWPEIDSMRRLHCAIEIIVHKIRGADSTATTGRRNDLSIAMENDLLEEQAFKNLCGTIRNKSNMESWNGLRPLVDIFNSWLDGFPIREMGEQVAKSGDAIRLLRLHVQSGKKLAESSTPVRVRVVVTPLFSYRMWPQVLNYLARRKADDLDFLRIDPENIELESDVEPDRLLHELADGGIWDVAVGYAEKSRIKNLGISEDRKHIVPMHRCLLLPSGTLASVGTPSRVDDQDSAIAAIRQLLNGKPLAVLSSFESIYGSEIAGLLATAGIAGDRLVRKPTTLELHSFVRAGRGACLTTLEAQGETDARLLDSFPLNAQFGESSMIVVKRRSETEDTDAQMDRVGEVFLAIQTYFTRYQERFAQAAGFQESLGRFVNCYISASTQVDAIPGENPVWGLHFWCGRVDNVQVQATLDTGMVRTSLCVSADYELFGASDEQISSHSLPHTVKSPLRFHLFGRLSDTKRDEGSSEMWQFSMRGAASDENAGDVFHSYLMFAVTASEKHLSIAPLRQYLSEAPEILVGHWIGHVDVETKPFIPDGGVIVLSPNKLTAEQLTSISIANRESDGFSLKLNLTLGNHDLPIPLVGVPRESVTAILAAAESNTP